MSSSNTEAVQLGTWPTPLEPAPRLAAAIGLDEGDLLIKRDDLSGLGAGGNKSRKLQWTCGQALGVGARTLVTSGAPQSNHARLTAAAGARLGLDVVLVLAGDRPPQQSPTGNLALDSLFGATIAWAGDGGEDALEAKVAQVEARLRDDGRRPFVIPFGGSTPLATNAYLQASDEIRGQGLDPEHVVVAVGSGGTMAGLVRGFGADRVLGVHCGAVANPEHTVAALLPDDHRSGLRVRTDQVGAGYSSVTPAVAAALELCARTEGIVLDPVYTGRALAGLIAEVEDGLIRPGSTVVFMHTGGLPGLFGSSAYLAML